MLDNIQKTSLLNIKGHNQNLFQINLDLTENSTNESTPEFDNSKLCEDTIESIKSKNIQNLFLTKKRNKINSVKNKKPKNAINELFSEFKLLFKKNK